MADAVDPVEIMARALEPHYWAKYDDGRNVFGEHCRNQAREQAQAALAALEAAGLRIVPVEPTEAMLDAGASEANRGGAEGSVYRAMIAASTPEPSGWEEPGAYIKEG